MFVAHSRRQFTAVSIRRSFSIIDNVMGFAGKQMEKKRDASFSDMIDLMLTSPKWTLRNVQSTLDKQLKSWTMYVPGVKSADQTKQVQQFKDILDKMSAVELDTPEVINGPIRDRIALSAGCSIDEVNKLLLAHKQGLITQKWLLMKKRGKETMPVNEQELGVMQENDPRIQPMIREVMMPDRRKRPSGRGRRSPF